MKYEKLFPRWNAFPIDVYILRLSRAISVDCEKHLRHNKWQVECGQYFIEVTRVEKFSQDVNQNSLFICFKGLLSVAAKYKFFIYL